MGAATLVTLALVLALASGRLLFHPGLDSAAANPPEAVRSAAASATETRPGTLCGRVTAHDGAAYEGRLRFGGDEEAFWGHYFNGFKDENPGPPTRRPNG